MAGLDHIMLPDLGQRLPYRPRVHPRKASYPDRDPTQHTRHLRAQLDLARRRADQIQNARRRARLPVGEIYLRFELEQPSPKVLESLETGQAQLAQVQAKDAQSEVAVLIAPYQQLEALERRLERYLIGPTTAKGKRRHEPLVNTIRNLDYPDLQSLWNDARPFPSEGVCWWEVWLLGGMDTDFRKLAYSLDIRVSPNSLHFPDREVVQTNATADQLGKVLTLQSSMTELRPPSSAHGFLDLAPREQRTWATGLAERLRPPPESAPRVCHLDTGVDSQHPVLRPACHSAACLAHHPNWSSDDRRGHGTQMAGLSLYGDQLSRLLADTQPVQLTHGLESVKILPDVGQNPEESLGVITQESVSAIEIAQPGLRRVFSMAVTADPCVEGKPSAWSASMDQVCSGADEEDQPKRLVIVSAGNLNPYESDFEYPTTNHSSQVQDPSQAWNVLTIGASTHLCELKSSDFEGWTPIAAEGGLCPSSTTSLLWSRDRPFKPEVCLEGGNYAASPQGQVADPDELKLLTTRSSHVRNPGALFTVSGDTSAACAQAAGLAAQIMAQYPSLWPESVRGLILHSASWTEAMLGEFSQSSNRQNIYNRLRCYGYGVPDLERALASSNHHPTLVAQSSLQPFIQHESGRIQLNEMHLYKLPWPEDQLLALGPTPVKLRVTLSYFIEPHPGERGRMPKHRYASYGLRFEVKRPTETDEQFSRRINKAEPSDEEEMRSESDAQSWVIGPQRHRGSIHSDTWEGTAAQLANCACLAVYPVKGWWAESKQRYASRARYSLIVSLGTKDSVVEVEARTVEVDLYTPIQVLVEQTIQVEGEAL